MSWNLEAERQLWRRRCVDSFWYFFKYAYGYDANPKGGAGHRQWLRKETHKEACDWFEMHALEWLKGRKEGHGKAKKLIVVVPRDWGKTTLFAQAGQAWLHLHDPELATYTGCETITRAREVLNGIKSVISGDDPYSRFAWLYGRQGPMPRRKWKVDGVVTAARTNLTRRDDSYGIWAVQSGMVGLHPDAGFFDDPNTYERMDRHVDWLDVVWNHMSTLIPVFQSDALWVLTATRYGEGDHIGRCIDRRRGGVRSMSGMKMPGVEIDPEGIWDVFYLDAIDDREEKPKLVMPQIWDWDRIKTFERENSVRYWAQVRNNPSQNPHNALPMTLIEKLVVSPMLVDKKRLRVSLHLDTAFKNPKRRIRGDFSVISAVGHEEQTGGIAFLGAKVRKEIESEEYISLLISEVKRWRLECARVSCITDEQDIGGKPGVWPALLQTKFREVGVRMPDLLILDRDSKRKEERLMHAATFWRNGKMKLLRDSENLEILCDQMAKIGLTEYNDLADATGDCWNKQVYRVIWGLKAEAAATASSNPFDDVLKPGPLGDAAAEKIAKMYMERDEQLGMRFDVVQ